MSVKILDIGPKTLLVVSLLLLSQRRQRKQPLILGAQLISEQRCQRGYC